MTDKSFVTLSKKSSHYNPCFSLLGLAFFVVLVVVAVFSCMVLNLYMNSIYLPKNYELDHFDGTVVEAFWQYEYLVTGIVTSLMCIGLIILDFTFIAVVHKFTEWECPRTRMEYADKYNFKLGCPHRNYSCYPIIADPLIAKFSR